MAKVFAVGLIGIVSAQCPKGKTGYSDATCPITQDHELDSAMLAIAQAVTSDVKPAIGGVDDPDTMDVEPWDFAGVMGAPYTTTLQGVVTDYIQAVGTSTCSFDGPDQELGCKEVLIKSNQNNILSALVIVKAATTTSEIDATATTLLWKQAKMLFFGSVALQSMSLSTSSDERYKNYITCGGDDQSGDTGTASKTNIACDAFAAGEPDPTTYADDVTIISAQSTIAYLQATLRYLDKMGEDNHAGAGANNKNSLGDAFYRVIAPYLEGADAAGATTINTAYDHDVVIMKYCTGLPIVLKNLPSGTTLGDLGTLNEDYSGNGIDYTAGSCVDPSTASLTQAVADMKAIYTTTLIVPLYAMHSSLHPRVQALMGADAGLDAIIVGAFALDGTGAFAAAATMGLDGCPARKEFIVKSIQNTLTRVFSKITMNFATGAPDGTNIHTAMAGISLLPEVQALTGADAGRDVLIIAAFDGQSNTSTRRIVAVNMEEGSFAQRHWADCFTVAETEICRGTARALNAIEDVIASPCEKVHSFPDLERWNQLTAGSLLGVESSSSMDKATLSVSTTQTIDGPICTRWIALTMEEGSATQHRSANSIGSRDSDGTSGDNGDTHLHTPNEQMISAESSEKAVLSCKKQFNDDGELHVEETLYVRASTCSVFSFGSHQNGALELGTYGRVHGRTCYGEPNTECCSTPQEFTSVGTGNVSIATSSHHLAILKEPGAIFLVGAINWGQLGLAYGGTSNSMSWLLDAGQDCPKHLFALLQNHAQNSAEQNFPAMIRAEHTLCLTARRVFASWFLAITMFVALVNFCRWAQPVPTVKSDAISVSLAPRVRQSIINKRDSADWNRHLVNLLVASVLLSNSLSSAQAAIDCTDSYSFNVGRGNCDTYAPGEQNHALCAADGAVEQCKTACRTCETAIKFFEWGDSNLNPPHREWGFNQTSTHGVGVLEAGGIETLFCTDGHSGAPGTCFATTLSQTSLAPAGTMVQWGRGIGVWNGPGDAPSGLDDLSKCPDATREAIENEGIKDLWATSCRILIETKLSNVFEWGRCGTDMNTCCGVWGAMQPVHSQPVTSQNCYCTSGTGTMNLLQTGGGIKVACATEYAFLVETNAGDIVTWGVTVFGAKIPSSIRTAIDSQGVAKCWSTDMHFMVLTDTGQVYAWGGESYTGALAAIPSDVERLIENEGIAKVVTESRGADSGSFCVLTFQHRARCWGAWKLDAAGVARTNNVVRTLSASMIATIDEIGVDDISGFMGGFVIKTMDGSLHVEGRPWSESILWTSDGSWETTKLALEAENFTWYGTGITFTAFAQSASGSLHGLYYSTRTSCPGWYCSNVNAEAINRQAVTASLAAIELAGGLSDWWPDSKSPAGNGGFSWVEAMNGDIIPAFLWEGRESLPSSFQYGGNVAGIWGYPHRACGIQCGASMAPRRKVPGANQTWNQVLGYPNARGFLESPCMSASLCSPGFEADENLTCTLCMAGRADTDSDSSTPCALCEAGTFVPMNGSTECAVCPSGAADRDSNPLTACEICSAGQYVLATSTACVDCHAGSADMDSDPATECDACDSGFYSATGASDCVHCPAGHHDDDNDPSTPCDTDASRCSAGHYSPTGSTECFACTSGTADEDGDPSTECSICDSGHFSAENSTNCEQCQAGQADLDQNASTLCTACSVGFSSSVGSLLCTACVAGRADLDSNPATACENCDVGSFASTEAIGCTLCTAGLADKDMDAATECTACDSGMYAPPSSTTCASCGHGKADLDANSSTACDDCPIGTFSPTAAVLCDACTPGRVDDDSSAATPCAACLRGQYNSLTGRFGGCEQCFAGRYAPVYASVGVDACEICSEGQFATNGSAACSSCTPGTADQDLDPSTPCAQCPNGTFASCGSTQCEWCIQGMSDSDFDAATPCVDCAPGQFWHYEHSTAVEADSDPGIAACVSCQAGQVDDDSDPLSPCTPCPDGQTSPQGSTTCIATNGQCTQSCTIGFEDHDCATVTPCRACTEGQYSMGGTALCQVCSPGLYAPPGSGPGACAGCTAGKWDNDTNAWTPCIACDSGSFTANDASELVNSTATQCLPCVAGRWDHDGNSSTACTVCDPGRFNPDEGRDNSCTSCAAGTWSMNFGSVQCESCPANSFRREQDIGCQPCGDEAYKCDETGLALPKAAPGYYIAQTDLEVELQTDVSELTKRYHKCSPFIACTGTCTADAIDADPPRYEDCPGAIGLASCKRGYAGERCSECVPFNQTRSAADCIDRTNPNGYYRLNELCEPCPCEQMSLAMIVSGLCVALVGFMVAIDYVLGDIDHLSSIFAPFMIAVNLFQTLALLLDLDVPWPAQLKTWLSRLNFLNLNLELAKPECSTPFGAEEKLIVTVLLPFFVLLCLGVYGAIKLVLARRVPPDQYTAMHGGRNVVQEVSRSVTTATASAFVFGSIFLLRRVLMTWVCTLEETVDGPTYLMVQPDIQCFPDNNRYNTLKWWSFAGLFMYLCFLGGFAAALYFKRDLFQFLGDKFEDRFYFWELVLVCRKVLVMACFVVFASAAEKAWFMGCVVMVASLILHAATKPYEDPTVDWCEFLSLTSTLFVFLTGVVYKILNDPANPKTDEQARSLSSFLENNSLLLMLANVLLAIYVEVRVWRQVASTDEDYRVGLIKAQIEAQTAELEELKAGAEKATAIAKLKADMRAGKKRSGGAKPDESAGVEEREFDNPISGGDGDDSTIGAESIAS